MAQAPFHPLVRSYLLRRPGWSDEHRAKAISILNRWCMWLGVRQLELVNPSTTERADAAKRARLTDAIGDDCATYLGERTAEVVGSTAHKDYQHLMWLYTWLVAEGEIDSRHERGPMHNISAPPVNDPDPERTRNVSHADYERLLASFDKRRVLDCRNAAICSLMYWSGLRRSEVCRCDLDRIDLDAGTLDVLGKNGKWRTVPLAMETVLLLERYLRRRADDPAEALFAVSFNGHEATTTGRMRPNAIRMWMQRRCERLGIDVTSHQFRRAMAINSKDRGMSDTSICTIADWADNRMLARYQRAAAARLAADDFHANDPTAKRAQARRRLRLA